MNPLFDYKNQNLRDVGQVAIGIMSHGEQNDEIVFSDGRKQTLFTCLEPLWSCEGLRGKPKLVITQKGFQIGTDWMAFSLRAPSSER